MALTKLNLTQGVTGLVPNDNTIRRPNAKPLIINGDMAVAQRGTSATGLTNGSDVYVALDRFGFNEFGSPSSQHTMTQESLTSGNAYINGFANALKMDVTTAQGSLDADDATMIIYKFEGQDLQLFKKGTANAEKFTLAFWVKGTKTGTHVVELFDKDNTRHVSGTYSISTTDTWEHKVVVFPADTTGVFGDDNARSLDINWFLSAGTNYTSGTLQTSWGGQADTTRAVGQVNTVDSTSNNWHITGIQLEVGEFSSTTLPPFQHETYAANLNRCLRYFQAPIFTSSQGVAEEYSVFGTGVYSSNSYFRCVRPLPVEMRVNPSLISSSGTNYFFILSGANDDVNDLTLFPDSNFKTAWVYNNDEASGTAGQAGILMGNNASAYAWLDAEL
jgi:hypothetical protein